VLREPWRDVACFTTATDCLQSLRPPLPSLEGCTWRRFTRPVHLLFCRPPAQCRGGRVHASHARARRASWSSARGRRGRRWRPPSARRQSCGAGLTGPAAPLADLVDAGAARVARAAGGVAVEALVRTEPAGAEAVVRGAARGAFQRAPRRHSGLDGERPRRRAGRHCQQRRPRRIEALRVHRRRRPAGVGRGAVGARLWVAVPGLGAARFGRYALRGSGGLANSVVVASQPEARGRPARWQQNARGPALAAANAAEALQPWRRVQNRWRRLRRSPGRRRRRHCAPVRRLPDARRAGRLGGEYRHGAGVWNPGAAPRIGGEPPVATFSPRHRRAEHDGSTCRIGLELLDHWVRRHHKTN